jgi:hypothetical protein
MVHGDYSKKAKAAAETAKKKNDNFLEFLR